MEEVIKNVQDLYMVADILIALIYCANALGVCYIVFRILIFLKIIKWHGEKKEQRWLHNKALLTGIFPALILPALFLSTVIEIFSVAKSTEKLSAECSSELPDDRTMEKIQKINQATIEAKRKLGEKITDEIADKIKKFSQQEFFETDYDYDNEEIKADTVAGRIFVRGMAGLSMTTFIFGIMCILLYLCFFGLTATPVLIYGYWKNNREFRRAEIQRTWKQKIG